MKPMRLHHVGIIMTTMEKAEAFLEKFGLEKDYMEYVAAYHAYCLFTKYTEKESPVELIIPTEGVLTEFNSRGQSVVMVTHDIRSARRGNRIVYLKDGVILGECDLGKYEHGDAARHEKLSAFLRDMGW